MVRVFVFVFPHLIGTQFALACTYITWLFVVTYHVLGEEASTLGSPILDSMLDPGTRRSPERRAIR